LRVGAEVAYWSRYHSPCSRRNLIGGGVQRIGRATERRQNALSDTPNGQGICTGTKGLKPPPVAKVTPWPEGAIALVNGLGRLVGELTCAWTVAKTPSHKVTAGRSIRFIMPANIKKLVAVLLYERKHRA
jgi:hypothetical protein